MKTDFTYRDDGEFVALMPETTQAQTVWNETIAPQTNGTGKLLKAHWPNVKAQLINAGYSVRKAQKSKVNDDQLLEDLLS